MGWGKLDTDESQDELEEMIDDDDEEDVVDFESLSAPVGDIGGESGGDDEEDDDEEDGITFKQPPRENEAMRMIQLFNSVYDTTTELASTMNVVIGEARKVTALSKKSGSDVEKIVENYEAAVLKINKQLNMTQKYFEVNKNIAKDLSFMKEELREEFKELNTTLLAAQREYVESISSSVAALSLKLGDFSKNIDLRGFEKVVKTEIEKVIKTSSIDRVQVAFDSIDKSFFLLEESVTKLAGVDDKKGLIEEFVEEVFTLEQKVDKMRNKSIFLSLVLSFLIGAVLSGGLVFGWVNADYGKRISVLMAEHAVRMGEVRGR